MDPLEQLADDLAAKLTPPADPASVPVSRRWAEIVTVNSTGTYDIELAQSGVTIPAVRALGYGTFFAGEVVVVDFTGSDPLIMGAVGSTDGWAALGLANGWVNYGAPWADAAARKVNGWVMVRGLVKNGAIGAVVGTLPIGFRPGANADLIFATDTSSGHGRVDVHSDGTITAQAGGNGYYSLSPIHFPVEL